MSRGTCNINKQTHNVTVINGGGCCLLLLLTSQRCYYTSNIWLCIFVGFLFSCIGFE